MHVKRLATKLPSDTVEISHPSHNNYLIKEEPGHIYLNIVDMAHLSHEFTYPIISAAVNFMKDKIDTCQIIIHCNQGVSRSPALALVFLAKILNEISKESYDLAKDDFIELYPPYCPGIGVDNYLRKHWNDLNF